MRIKRMAVFTVALSCACAGGPALAAVAGRSPRAGPATGSPPVAPTETAPINTSPLTSTLTTTGTTTTDTTTTTGTTTTTTTSATPTMIVCIPAERRALAGALRVRAAAIHQRQFIATNGMPQCNYVVARAHRGGPAGKVVVTVNVDNGPQAGWRLMRKVAEATQIFGPVPKGWKPPIGVRGLGAYASWFPNLNQLMANNVNRRYLITVGVSWRGSTRLERISLARAAIMPYRRARRLPG